MIATIPGWLTYVIIALQILCCLHALRTHQRFWWFFLIIFIPLIGVTVYLLYYGRQIFPKVPLPAVKIPLVEKLNERAIEKTFQESDTLDNRIDYANVLINRGQAGEAVELLKEALAGPLAKNVVLLFAASRAHYAQGQLNEAIDCLRKAEDIPNSERIKQRNLLMAICLHDQGDVEQAETYYKDSLTGTLSEESRVRYALFLKQQGRLDDAREMLNKVLKSLKTAPFAYRREQASWAKLAQQTLNEL